MARPEGPCARCGEALLGPSVRGLHLPCYHRALRAGELRTRRQHRCDPVGDRLDVLVEEAAGRREDG